MWLTCAMAVERLMVDGEVGERYDKTCDTRPKYSKDSASCWLEMTTGLVGSGLGLTLAACSLPPATTISLDAQTLPAPSGVTLPSHNRGNIKGRRVSMEISNVILKLSLGAERDLNISISSFRLQALNCSFSYCRALTSPTRHECSFTFPRH